MKMRNALHALFLLPAMVHGATLEVRVDGLREARGHVLVALADSAESWDGKAAPRARIRHAVAAGSETIRFDDLPPGTYAVSLFHDENDNGVMDKNVVGMPTEGYGFSRNPRVMRKATFEEARFELAADGGEIVVELR